MEVGAGFDELVKLVLENLLFLLLLGLLCLLFSLIEILVHGCDLGPVHSDVVCDGVGRGLIFIKFTQKFQMQE